MRSLALVLVATATYTVTHGFSVIDERRGLRTRELHSSVPGSSPALPPGSRVPGSSPALPPGGGIKFPGYYPKGDSRHVPEEELGFSKGLLASNDFATRCNGKVFLEKIVDYKDSSLPGADYYFLDEDNNLKAYRYPGSCGKRTFKNFWDYISISNICPDTLITDVCKDKRAFHVYMKKDSDGVRATCLIPTWTNTLPPNQAQEYCNSKKICNVSVRWVPVPCLLGNIRSSSLFTVLPSH
mmetsp:Transcript_1908/g.3067  ORF Transcript_1908/g.3067 Transcript_1908/m.3067 type:complete len:240 (-) Transcript_1908:136-855(-)